MAKFPLWLLVSLFSLAGFLLYHFCLTEQKLDTVEVTSVKTQCSLQAPSCSFNLTDGTQLELALSPRGLPALEPLTLSISSSALSMNQVQNIQVWFEGSNMEMGHHYFNLIYADNQVVGKGMIPICTINLLMVWQMNVAFRYQGENQLISFELI